MAGSQDFTTNGSNAQGYQASGPSYTYDNQYKDDQGFQNRNSFGGYVGGADTNVNRYRSMGAADASRSAYQGNYGDSNQVRGMQLGSLALLDQRARGAAPSAAEISGNAAMDKSLAQQVAVARSGRGGAAQQQAALNAAGTGLASSQAGMVAGIQAGRANEMANATGQLVGAEQGTREQDLQTQAQLQQSELAQRQLNQQGQQFNEGLAFQTNAAQLQANQNAQGQANAMGQANIQNSQQSSDFGWGKVKDVVAMAGGAASGGAGAALGAVATGGHIHGEHPYLVGEEGTELVAPKEDGYVMTALQTAKILGAPPTAQQLAALTPEQRKKLAELRTPARAFGGPIGPYVPSGDFSVGDGMIMSRTGGLDIGASERATNAIDTQYMHHAGSNPVGPASFAREEGGPVNKMGAQPGAFAALKHAIADRIAMARANIAEARATPVLIAPPQQPRAAVVESVPKARELAVSKGGEVAIVKPDQKTLTTMPAPSSVEYAPAAVSSAPVGMVSAPVVASAVPARACGGYMTRAEGGPIDSFMSQEERAAAGDPYAQAPDIGVAGAPRGYAAARAGQPGYMFGDAPVATHGYEKAGADYDGQAPGTEDFARYGAPAAKDKDPDWKRGGATTPAGAGASGGNWISRLLLGMSGGLQGAR